MKKAPRDFDFERYNERHVAFLFSYLGHDYSGLAYQPDNDNTVEHALFEGLKRIKLCRFDGEAPVGFSRCGRTDKGVSAWGNVFALHARSCLTDGVEFVRCGEKVTSLGKPDELDYVHLINRVLPPAIRVRAWCPVAVSFSARFSCEARTYRYYFPTQGLDVAAMRAESNFLLGEHDFRNFCKMDGGVENFVRTLHSVDITGTDGCVACATIRGSAFLYHQVRCIMAVLFMVGRGEEGAGVVSRLLDLVATPKKPPYELAEDHNLCLWHCDYPEGVCGVSWRHSDVADVAATLDGAVGPAEVRAAMLRSMLTDVGGGTEGIISRRPHVPLADRPPEKDFGEVMDRKQKRTERKRAQE